MEGREGVEGGEGEGEGEGRGGAIGEGRVGEGGERRGGRRGGMTLIHILMTPQYLNTHHVTYYVITEVGIRLGIRRTMVRNYYVRRDVDRVSH